MGPEVGHWSSVSRRSSVFILLTLISYTPLSLRQERSARGVKIKDRFLELIYGASFWYVCHVPSVHSAVTCVDCLQLKRSMIGWTRRRQYLAGLAWSMAVALLTRLQSQTLQLHLSCQHLETCRLHWPYSSSSMPDQLTLKRHLNLMWTLQPLLSPWMPATHCSTVIYNTLVHIWVSHQVLS